MSESLPVLQKKVCMLGAYAVGKTSLVSRFVRSIFSDKYQTTVGVKIDKKTVSLGDRQLTFILWDLAGEDEFIQVRMSYLRGSAGYLLVADGLRRITLDKAIELQQRVEGEIGKLPFILLINKLDVIDDWEIKESDIESLSVTGWHILATSAKTGVGVQETFLALGQKTLAF
ncbi:MAG TPA: Rab family GTPase [Blastocatellia bacterium]|nr:Rab family GTPase [Blastocatellia bacterium]